jgi:predicted transcriptional regulator
MDRSDNAKSPDLQSLVAEIVSSYVRKNYVEPGDLSVVINTVYQSLLAAGKPPTPNPAVPISKSATRNYVVCLDCGWRGKALTRHVQAKHGLKENEYRARWGLPSTHRLSATAYSKQRSAWVKQLGLTRSKTDTVEEGEAVHQQSEREQAGLHIEPESQA